MAQTYVRLNLNSAIYPFYVDAGGRTIDIPQLDQNFDRFNAANTTPDKGVPQVFYLHNTVPIAGGFQSVGYNKAIEGLPGVTSFDTAYTLFSQSFEGDQLPVGLFVPAQGRNYVYNAALSQWQQVSPLDPVLAANKAVYVATVRNVSYIFYEGIGLFTYDSYAPAISHIYPTGIDMALTNGIIEASGYLITWTKYAIAWSSPANALDFEPTNRTGAGGGNVQEAKGEINFCVRVPDGFIIFCDKNAVGATYTGNTDYPFIFKEISGSGGARFPTDMAFQGNTPYFPGLTSAGIQQVSINNVIPTMQEVSDFLTSGLFEDFDETTNVFSVTRTQIPIYVRFQSVANKYIAISYGLVPGEYTHAIVYDILLNRYGKLKIDHRYIFDFVPPPVIGGSITYDNLMTTPINSLYTSSYASFWRDTDTNVQTKNNIGILQKDGTIYTVNFDIMEPTSNGVFIIGKFQHIRERGIYHQTSEYETIRYPNNFEVFILPTLNGKDFLPAVPTVTSDEGDTFIAKSMSVAGKNISLLLKGSYNLTTIILRYTLGGWR